MKSCGHVDRNGWVCEESVYKNYKKYKQELEGRLSFLLAHHAVFVRQQVPSRVYMSAGSHKTLDTSFYKTYYRLAKIPVY